MTETAIPEDIREAARVLYAWAKREIIVEECREDRVAGCLSCETIRFFEAVADELEDDELRH